MINIFDSMHNFPIELSDKLKEKNIVTEFYYHIPTQNLKIALNHNYQPINAIFKIDIDDWSKNAEKISKIFRPKGVNKEDTELIIYTLDNHWKKILEIINNDNSTIVFSDLSDLSDHTNHNDDYKIQSIQQQLQESPQQNNISRLTVLEAKRSSEGKKRVVGRIVGRSTNFRVIAKSEWKCKNSGKCNNRASSIYNPPKLALPQNLDNTIGTNPSCFKCKKYDSLIVNHDYRNAKIIQLDDIDTIEEKFDRLDVILYDDASDWIIDGEIVEIEGIIYTQRGITKSVNKSNKMVNILHSDKPIIYKNRKEIKITEKDIDNFYKWKQICRQANKKELDVLNKYSQLKKEDRPNWVKQIKPMTFEQRITTMFAPNVYGHSDKKKGILRSIIGGKKSENGADNGRRGRIHTLLIGDPGTSKTVLSTESTKLDINSRMVDATGASGKSLVGIVDKENDSLMVKYGVVVAAKNSHVVINEASSLSHDDQGHLVGIAEEGITTLDKWAEHIPIDAPTTLLLTANPIGTKWNSPKISKDKMVVIRQNLLDRIDQIYGFFDAQTKEEMEEFIEEMTKIKNRKPHNYNFLIKYVQYVKTIEPKWVGNAGKRFNRFWINARLQGIAGNRTFFSIKRIAEAQAKLNLSHEIDDIIANQTMQSLALMFMQYGKIIEQIQNPRDVTVEVFYSILKNNNKTGYTIYELCKKGSEKNTQIKEYLKTKWSLENNKELRDIMEMLEQKQGIKITNLKPRVLQYFDDISEDDNRISDLYNTSDQHHHKSINNNNENFPKDKQIDETDRSERSESKEEYISDVKLVSLSDFKKSNPIEMTKEQYDSWAGNENGN